MKKILTLFLIFSALLSFSQVDEKPKVELIPAENDSIQYELIIPEPGFVSWFATNRKPQWYHSHEYYKKYNDLYSRAWNIRVVVPGYGSPYDYSINYDFNTNYGIELDYKLYWFFQFMEDKYNLNLLTSRQKK